MARELMHGNRELWYATITDGVIGVPQRWYGLASTEQEAEQESENIYKDDVVYYTLEGDASYKLTVKVAQIPEEFATACLGYVKTQEGAWSVSGTPKPCVIFFKNTILDGSTGAERPKLHFFYNALPSLPKLENETDEDKPKENEIEIEFTCTTSTIVTDADGIGTPFGTIERTVSNSAFFDTYTSTVLVPQKVLMMSAEGGEE